MAAAPLIRFLLRCGAYLAAVAAVLAVYVYCADPLRVMRRHEAYYTDGLYTNWNVAGVNNFELMPDRRSYDSFVLGSSVSKSLLAEAWKRHLEPGARVYHLGSDGQSIPVVRMAMEYAAANVDSLRHVIIVMNMWSMQKGIRHEPVFEPHPHLYGNRCDRVVSWIRHAWYSLNREVGAARLQLEMTGTLSPKMAEVVDFRPSATYDARTNELLPNGRLADGLPRKPGDDAKVAEMCREFRFTVDAPRITPAFEADLRAIARIAAGRGATLDWILVGCDLPSESDDRLLREVFGAGYHNMCTAFADEQRSPDNYYDTEHFYPEHTTRILDAALSASE